MRNYACRSSKIIRAIDRYLTDYNDPILKRDVLVSLIAHYLRGESQSETGMMGELTGFYQEVMGEMLGREAG